MQSLFRRARLHPHPHKPTHLEAVSWPCSCIRALTLEGGPPRAPAPASGGVVVLAPPALSSSARSTSITSYRGGTGEGIGTRGGSG